MKLKVDKHFVLSKLIVQTKKRTLNYKEERKRERERPGKIAAVGLPPPVLITPVRPAMFLTRQLGLYVGTI